MEEEGENEKEVEEKEEEEYLEIYKYRKTRYKEACWSIRARVSVGSLLLLVDHGL